MVTESVLIYFIEILRKISFEYHFFFPSLQLFLHRFYFLEEF